MWRQGRPVLACTAPFARPSYATAGGKTMARYVDGFVIPMQKRKVKAYLAQAKMGAKLWKDHGALGYTECVGEDLKIPYGLGFPRMNEMMKEGEPMPFDLKRFAVGGFEVLVSW
jgi:uncharacterized protein YbaA (DUF1428 family)